MQIIVDATRNGARSCHMENEPGKLKADKPADVRVVDGDLFADVHAVTNARLLLREGKSIWYISID